MSARQLRVGIQVFLPLSGFLGSAIIVGMRVARGSTLPVASVKKLLSTLEKSVFFG